MMYYKVKVRPHISTHLRGLSAEKKNTKRERMFPFPFIPKRGEMEAAHQPVLAL